MEYQITVTCPVCKNQIVISKDQAAELISEGLQAAKRIKTIYAKYIEYPTAECSKCDNILLIDENMSFK
jgi:phage pi2 protein 07